MTVILPLRCSDCGRREDVSSDGPWLMWCPGCSGKMVPAGPVRSITSEDPNLKKAQSYEFDDMSILRQGSDVVVELDYWWQEGMEMICQELGIPKEFLDLCPDP